MNETADTPLAYVISPQSWAGFHVAKHHYAIALVARGWNVVFVDPPTDLGQPGRIEMTQTDVPGIISLRYQTFFPYRLKFRLRALFGLLMRRQARQIVRVAGQPDLVWDFDNAYQFRDLRVFGARATFFHLVDDVGTCGLGTKHADHMFYLHPSFCTHAGSVPKPEHEIGHGLGKMHETAARRQEFGATVPGAPHVGFVGNLAAPWIDWAAIDTMLERHPEARFTFWGPRPALDSDEASLKRILRRENARFPGLTPPEEIAAAAHEVDVWLLPFLPDRLLGGPLNSHKILEYLSTGKAVVMNWLEAYDGNPLVHMLPNRSGHGLADLLDAVLADLKAANAPEMMARRRNFALQRTYDRNLDHILSIANPAVPRHADAT